MRRMIKVPVLTVLTVIDVIQELTDYFRVEFAYPEDKQSTEFNKYVNSYQTILSFLIANNALIERTVEGYAEMLPACERLQDVHSQHFQRKPFYREIQISDYPANVA